MLTHKSDNRRALLTILLRSEQDPGGPGYPRLPSGSCSDLDLHLNANMGAGAGAGLQKDHSRGSSETAGASPGMIQMEHARHLNPQLCRSLRVFVLKQCAEEKGNVQSEE